MCEKEGIKFVPVDWFEKDLINFQFDELIKDKHAYSNKKAPIDNMVTWITRNHIMIARIRTAIEKYEGKRILCTVGAEHNYFYYEELKKLGYNVVYPLK